MAGNTNELPMNPKVISRPSPPPQPSLIFPIPVQPLKTYALFHFAGMSLAKYLQWASSGLNKKGSCEGPHIILDCLTFVNWALYSSSVKKQIKKNHASIYLALSTLSHIIEKLFRAQILGNVY